MTNQENSFEQLFETHGRPIGRFEKQGDEWNRSSNRSMKTFTVSEADGVRARELAAQQMAETSNAAILREYRANGIEPQYIGGTLASPQLAMRMGLIPTPHDAEDGL